MSNKNFLNKKPTEDVVKKMVKTRILKEFKTAHEYMPVNVGYAKNGEADFKYTIHGLTVDIETKRPGTRKLSKNQELRRDSVVRAGGIYAVVNCEADLQHVIDTIHQRLDLIDGGFEGVFIG